MRHALLLLPLLAACSGSPIGQEPGFTSVQASPETVAMVDPAGAYAAIPTAIPGALPTQTFFAPDPSLWEGGRGSLFGDDRARARGDILTVVIEIDDSAQISNASGRSREASRSLGVGSLFGLPEALEGELSGDAGIGTAVDLDSATDFSGTGSVRRSERLELRVAATVTDVLPSGALQIAGSQEVRVNFELRELLVTGFVRPEDVSRDNEVAYDRIAQARISYGGRGQISQVQQPPIGQQALDYALPF